MRFNFDSLWIQRLWSHVRVYDIEKKICWFYRSCCDVALWMSDGRIWGPSAFRSVFLLGVKTNLKFNLYVAKLKWDQFDTIQCPLDCDLSYKMRATFTSKQYLLPRPLLQSKYSLCGNVWTEECLLSFAANKVVSPLWTILSFFGKTRPQFTRPKPDHIINLV